MESFSRSGKPTGVIGIGNGRGASRIELVFDGSVGWFRARGSCGSVSASLCQDQAMSFAREDVDDLLARTGRMCAICNRLHGVQVHHITPVSEGGADDVSNAVPLCPNCHNETHAKYASGRTTRLYTERELRSHLARTIELAARQFSLRPGSADWQHDVDLVAFYGTSLDRPAFRTHFHNELSFADFDQALEDTVLALNTGYLRTRDGTVIKMAEGKRDLVNRGWAEAIDTVVRHIMEARTELRRGLGLDQMLVRLEHHPGRWLDRYDVDLRSNRALGMLIDQHRQDAIDVLNGVLDEARLAKLKAIGNWA